MGFLDRLFKRDTQKSGLLAFIESSNYDTLCAGTYTKLRDCPEVQMAVNKIANLISSMTIQLMENRENGDVRIRNELSRKVDIEPCGKMTRKNWLHFIVSTLLLEGEGNAFVLPTFDNEGKIKELIPLPPSDVKTVEVGGGYTIQYGGKVFAPDEVLHFAINPSSTKPWKGTGYKVALADVTRTLKQSDRTKRAFLEDKWRPSLIVSIDSDADDVRNREKKQGIIKDYLTVAESGQPWVVPMDMFKVEQVKPLSLNDLALNESVVIDKRTVAGIFDIPAFLLGVGEFDRDEFNNFITTGLLPLAKVIEQTLTRGLLLNPSWHFRLSPRSLYSYSLTELASIGGEMYTRGLMTGNETRDWLGLSPLDGLDQLVILENYIPAEKIGDQKKLKEVKE